jgi:hypothetical protein
MRDHAHVFKGVILHLENDLPVMADLEDFPAGSDVLLRCTNVRLLDGKRPAFVHDAKSVFVIPLSRIRAMEVPRQTGTTDAEDEAAQEEEMPPEPQLEPVDEEAEEDLLARIRQI